LSGLIDVILERRSIRKFDKNRKIPEEVSKLILEAGINAPSAGNIQPRTFIIVENENVKAQLYELCEKQRFMLDAPLWIVVCVDLHRHLRASELSGVKYDFTGILPYTFAVLDTALSLENMVLAAEALGLGSVIIGSVIEHPEKAKQILRLPSHCLAISILCIGYPAKSPPKRKKWNYEVIVCKDHYREITKEDVENYWKELMVAGLKRAGKRLTEEEINEILKKRSYGKAYSAHYTEEFIREVNRKLISYLVNNGFLKRSNHNKAL